MADMSIGVQCLLAPSIANAQPIARSLATFNHERKSLQDSMQTEAMKQASQHQKKPQKGAVLYSAQWHQGIIGIIASRVKEFLHQPCIVFSDDGDTLLKGSGRSIEGVHLRDVLARVSEKTGILNKFGGHAMAAGLTISKSDHKAFTNAFQAELSLYPEDVFIPKLYSDGPIGLTELNIETAQALLDYGIWGHGYPEPLFEAQMRVLHVKIVKTRHLKLTLQVRRQRVVEAMWFFCPETAFTQISEESEHLFFFKLAVSEYLGERKLNLFVEHTMPVQA